MVIAIKVPSVGALRRLHQISFSVPEEVQVRTRDGSRTVSAKSPLGLFSLDYSLPVEIVTDSPAVLAELKNWS